MTTTLDQEALDHVARCLQTIQTNLGPAVALLSQMQRHGITPEHLHRLSEYLERGVEASGAAMQSTVHALGAQSPGLRTERDELRLDQLDTQATRNLLACLRDTVRAAHLVDKERGWVDEDDYGYGWQETVAGWEIGLRREIHGATGSGRE